MCFAKSLPIDVLSYAVLIAVDFIHTLFELPKKNASVAITTVETIAIPLIRALCTALCSSVGAALASTSTNPKKKKSLRIVVIRTSFQT